QRNNRSQESATIAHAGQSGGHSCPAGTETGKVSPNATTTFAMCANVKRKTIGSFWRHWNGTRKGQRRKLRVLNDIYKRKYIALSAPRARICGSDCNFSFIFSLIG